MLNTLMTKDGIEVTDDYGNHHWTIVFDLDSRCYTAKGQSLPCEDSRPFVSLEAAEYWCYANWLEMKATGYF